MHQQLAEEIIALSDADHWSAAKREWSFSHAYMCEDGYYQTCLCGHYPIKEICVISNDYNGNDTEVGNCCVNKFLEIESANKIFTSVKRLKEDMSKSMSEEVLDYLMEKRAITGSELEFYSDIIRKRKLSEKQEAYKQKINRKLIAFTSYESQRANKKITKILEWSKDHKEFRISFVQSVSESYKRSDKISAKQMEALDNIIKKFKIR